MTRCADTSVGQVDNNIVIEHSEHVPRSGLSNVGETVPMLKQTNHCFASRPLTATTSASVRDLSLFVVDP